MEIIVHAPDTEEMRQELARRTARIHAQTVMENLRMLSCPVEQKVQLMNAIIEKRGGRTR